MSGWRREGCRITASPDLAGCPLVVTQPVATYNRLYSAEWQTIVSRARLFSIECRC